MRCYICDKAIDDPQWSRDHKDWEPCTPCQTVIQDTLDGYKDNTYTDDDELPDEVIPEGYEGLRRFLEGEDAEKT